jgi:hypothetical protein
MEITSVRKVRIHQLGASTRNFTFLEIDFNIVSVPVLYLIKHLAMKAYERGEV